MSVKSLALCAPLAILCLAAPTASAQSARNVLLVVNTASQDSVRVGEHYARVRGIDQEQVLRIEVESKDEIPRPVYERAIENPIGAWLARNAAQDRILFIVLTRGIPLRIGGTGGRQGTIASVDSELALLYRKLTRRPVPPQGPLPNPYFLGAASIAQARSFTHEQQDIYLVTRLDGFTVDDAIAVIDRAQKPAQDGRVVLDMKAAWTDQGNEWLKAAAERLQAMGKGGNVQLDTTSEVVTGTRGVLGYYSWGSNDPAIKVRTFGFEFLPGAIAGMFVSSDGRTFKEPPREWKPSNDWSDRRTWFEGSPQSLAGDLIRGGVTGVAGHVAEPFLDGTIRPDILFPAYLSGFTLAEAYYLAMPYLSWQTIVVGDPLCQVATMKRPDETMLTPPIDPGTEMPRFFSQRRLQAEMDAAAPGTVVNKDAVRLAMQADARIARGDRAAAEEALVKLTQLEPRFVAAQLVLASLFEERKEYGKAAECYRAVLDADSNNVVALNNLAYSLAVREKKPGDALPLAERAYTVSRGNPVIADTLGWVHHLLGNRTEAARYISEAIAGEQGNAELHLHAAVIYAEGGQLEAAKKAYARAIELDKAMADRDEAKELQGKLK